MKKLIICSVLGVFLYSCKIVEPNLIPRREVFSGIDFLEYSKNGFLFTPEKYEGDYESIGLVSFLIMPEAVKEKTDAPDTQSYRDLGPVIKWRIEDVNIQNAVEGIYKHCIEMGANALVNFKIEVKIEDYSNRNPPIKLEGYRITGFAIKRKTK